MYVPKGMECGFGGAGCSLTPDPTMVPNGFYSCPMWPTKMTELFSTGCLGPHGEPVEVGINGDGLWGPEPEGGGAAN